MPVVTFWLLLAATLLFAAAVDSRAQSRAISDWVVDNVEYKEAADAFSLVGSRVGTGARRGRALVTLPGEGVSLIHDMSILRLCRIVLDDNNETV